MLQHCLDVLRQPKIYCMEKQSFLNQQHCSRFPSYLLLMSQLKKKCVMLNNIRQENKLQQQPKMRHKRHKDLQVLHLQVKNSQLMAVWQKMRETMIPVQLTWKLA